VFWVRCTTGMEDKEEFGRAKGDARGCGVSEKLEKAMSDCQAEDTERNTHKTAKVIYGRYTSRGQKE
jgi:hypothetical protein